MSFALHLGRSLFRCFSPCAFSNFSFLFLFLTSSLQCPSQYLNVEHLLFLGTIVSREPLPPYLVSTTLKTMDIYITSDIAHQSNASPKPNFFEPLNPKKRKDAPPTIEFHLIIADPASDSSLTPGWAVPVETLVVPATMTLGMLFSILREHLPVRRHRFGLSAVLGSGGSSGSVNSVPASATFPVMSSSSNTSSAPPSPAIRSISGPTESTPTAVSTPAPRSLGASNLLGKLRRPKLDYARVFLARSPDGEVVPLCSDDADWHFKGGYVRVDLMSKSEMEWRLFKELVVAAEGQFKCYIAIKGASSRSPFLW